MGHDTAMSDAAARQALKQDLARYHCRVHQPDDPPLFTREPSSATQTVHWRWRDLEPLLERLGREIALGSAGMRRTLRLQNPGLPYGTTHTFWASIQVILPGEVAEAHRHTASAFRFIMKGGGATTTVDGECYPMHEGDLVLTPAMTWHDHVHKGSEPMIWLDVLDISLMRAVHGTFFEGYPDRMQPVAEVPDRSFREFGSGLMRPVDPGERDGPNPLLAYPADMAMAALERAAALPADPYDDVVLEYQNPRNGGPAMRTMGMRLQKLRAGARTQARRHTGSKLYYIVRGHGSTIVDGRRYDWAPGDFLTVQPWAWHEHHNDTGEDAVLFQVNDIPAMQALGYYREQALGGHQTIEEQT
ncbi:cupin domain-containing protein [Verticiella sediminum]|uniref:Cupin domain-containing protein n=1 Tax=Verticiella sediminum TaxID=1247510 RepID=A0A556B1X7_9BURK|nr:cupin domain-containing protein [Verticiella sediminum]TSH99197.1 cupin domain-containing protein [Verticiella sediminum]